MRRPGALMAAAVVIVAGGVGWLAGPGRPAPPDGPRVATSAVVRRATSLPAPTAGFAVPAAHGLNPDARVTRWAPVLVATRAHELPSATSPTVVAVGTRTPEGTTNLVVADGETTRHDETWVHVRLAVLPDGRTGWIPRRALGGWSFVDTSLVIDREDQRLTLYRDGRAVFRARVGVGAPGTPTPAGRFYVRDRLTAYARPEYGPLAFGTSARSEHETDWPAGGFIGIHGTDQPGLIPGRISHGCIRLRDAAMVSLGRLMPIGTPVTIR